jgi:hypothetical protein
VLPNNSRRRLVVKKCVIEPRLKDGNMSSPPLKTLRKLFRNRLLRSVN